MVYAAREPHAGRCSASRSTVFVGPAISCQDGRSTYGPLGLPTTVGVMTLITRQCFAIPTSSRELRDCKIDEEGSMTPTGRASEKQKRSDLIYDRETSRLLTIAPVPSTANLHLRIHLFPHPPSSRVFHLSSVARPSSVPPLRCLPCLPLCCSRVFSRAEFIPPAKYPRVHFLISLPSSLLRFSLPSFRVQARFSFPLSFIPIPSFISCLTCHHSSISWGSRFFESPSSSFLYFISFHFSFTFLPFIF